MNEETRKEFIFEHTRYTTTTNPSVSPNEDRVSWNPSTSSGLETCTPHRPEFVGYEVNVVARVFFILIGSVQILSGLVGSLLLLALIFRRRQTRVRSGHEYFIGNLALCDLLTLGYWMTYFVLDLYMGHHPVVNMAHCKVNAFVIAICFVTTALSLTSITLNRYLYVCHDRLYSRIFSLRTTIAWCLIVWVLSAAIITPPLVGVGSYHYNPSGHFCSFNRQDPNPYPRIVVMLCSLLPMVFVGYWNYAIYRFWRTARGKLKTKKNNGKKRGGVYPFSPTVPSTQLHGGCRGAKRDETDLFSDQETGRDNDNDLIQQMLEEGLCDQNGEAIYNIDDAEEDSSDTQKDIQEQKTELHSGGGLQRHLAINVCEETSDRHGQQQGDDKEQLQGSNKDQDASAPEVSTRQKSSLPVQMPSNKLLTHKNKKQHESASGKPFIRKNKKHQELHSDGKDTGTIAQELTMSYSDTALKTKTRPPQTASSTLFTCFKKKQQKEWYSEQKALKAEALPVQTASKRVCTRGYKTQEEVDKERNYKIQKGHLTDSDELYQEESSSIESDDDFSTFSANSFPEVDSRPKIQPLSAQSVALRLLNKSSTNKKRRETDSRQKVIGLNSGRAQHAPNSDQRSCVLQPQQSVTEREERDQTEGRVEREGSVLKRVQGRTKIEGSPLKRFQMESDIEEKEGSVRREEERDEGSWSHLKRFRRTQKKEDSSLEESPDQGKWGFERENSLLKRLRKKMQTEDSPLKRLQRKQKSKQSKEEAFVRSLRVVFLMMVIAFLPYGVSIIAQTFTPLPTELTIAADLFLFSNNAVNWIVYGVMNPSFRRGYAKTLRCLLRPFTRAFSRPPADGDTGVVSIPQTTIHSTTAACSSNQSDTE